MAEVRFQQVSKHFGAVRAVRDLDLTISDEEFLVFVGPSGCGKSTVLRMLAGLETVTTGDIRIGDRRVNDVPPKDRDIAMVFQSYALYPHMSVYDNMAFGLKLRNVPREKIDDRVRQAAAILGLEDLLERKPKQLSGGQRQRVAVGRAIVRQPAVFLMDEPLSNLDAKLRVAARAEIMALHRRLRTTFVYVTHDQVEAMTMGDRIAILRDGILQQVDAPATVYRAPANVFVGGFIGSPSMNFFSAELVASNGRTELDARDFRVPAPAWLAAGHGERAVTVGVRPESIHAPAFVGPGPALVPLRGTVEVVELLGYEAHLHVRTRHGRLVANVDGRVEASEGDEMELLVDARDLHLFDADTEEALRPPAGA